MLDQYVHSLVKEANVQTKLDGHLEEMVKKASAEVEADERLANASAEDLAKMAGITLPEGTCPQCASEMQKLGSVYQCPCGMMKRAKAPVKTAMDKTASLAKVAQVYSANGEDLDATYAQLRAEGYEKLGFNPMGLLRSAGSGLKSMGSKMMANPTVAAGVGKAKDVGAKVMASKPAQAVQQGYQQVGKQVGGAMQQAKSPMVQRAGQFVTKHPGATMAGAATAAGAGTGALTAGEGRRGRGMLAGAMGGLGGGMIGGGLMGAATRLTPASKTVTASVDIAKVGDAAGRLLAKIAVQKIAFGEAKLTPEEVGEAIQGAKARENIPGRAASWGRGGAAIGGTAGAAGGAGLGMLASRLLGGKGKIVAPLLGAAAGGAGGGMAGHRIGKAEGAEEAAADRLVSMIRGRRAYGAGAQRGFQAGRSYGAPDPQ